MDSAEVVSSVGSNFAEYFGVALAVAIIVVGTAYGIGKIGSKAMESIARQPEAKEEIRTTMILAAAFIEGVAFFAAVVCLIIVLTK